MADAPPFQRQPDGLEVCPCETAREMLSALSFGNDLWIDPQRPASGSEWAFRGQNDARWGLTPSAVRADDRVIAAHINRLNAELERVLLRVEDRLTSDLLPDTQFLSADAAEALAQQQINIADATQNLINNPNFKPAALQILAERAAILEFIEAADQIAQPIPTDQHFDFAAGQYNSMSPEFLDEYLYDLLIGCIRDYLNLMEAQQDLTFDLQVNYPRAQVTALAQHHGIPTRLLDWTNNPLVAAFFAAFEAETRPDVSQIVVWAVNRRAAELFLRFVIPFRSGNTYMQIQGGLFSYDPKANASYLGEGRWPSHDTVLLRHALDSPETLLRKITLPVSQASDLLRRLSASGVTRRALMPTLDNAALDIKARYK
jgi:hypothetical protein